MQNWQVPADLELSSDAASTCGCSAIFGNFWFALRWPVDMALPHISVLELISIVWLPVTGEILVGPANPFPV